MIKKQTIFYLITCECLYEKKEAIAMTHTLDIMLKEINQFQTCDKIHFN